MTQKNTRPATANIPPFGLRMQPELKMAIEEAARKNNRSLNAEIVSRLEYSVETDRLNQNIEYMQFQERTADQNSAIKSVVEEMVDRVTQIINENKKKNSTE